MSKNSSARGRPADRLRKWCRHEPGQRRRPRSLVTSTPRGLRRQRLGRHHHVRHNGGSERCRRSRCGTAPPHWISSKTSRALCRSAVPGPSEEYSRLTGSSTSPWIPPHDEPRCARCTRLPARLHNGADEAHAGQQGSKSEDTWHAGVG